MPASLLSDWTGLTRHGGRQISIQQNDGKQDSNQNQFLSKLELLLVWPLSCNFYRNVLQGGANVLQKLWQRGSSISPADAKCRAAD